MNQVYPIRCAAIAALALTVGGCTMKEQDAPALTGPSEFGQSITVTASPDVLTQDGASQSVITVLARGANGAPLSNLSLRAEIVVQDAPTDFGRLSARNIVTGSSGQATVVYTAPASPAGPVVDAFTLVNIQVTPIGTDFGNSTSRITTLRLVPNGGIIVPPDGLRPAFTFTPAAPTDNQDILFDASTSEAPANNPIVRYQWNFGDGGTATGITTTYAYSTPGTYTVTLTVTDAHGRSRSTSRTIAVGEGAGPTPQFNFSPVAPAPGQDVFFNASQSTAAAGRRLVSYGWVWGDGTTTTDEDPLTSKRYTSPGTYRVTLTVTDDAGRTATSAPTNVVVAVPAP